MTKRILSFLLAISLCCTLIAGCGKQSPEKTTERNAGGYTRAEWIHSLCDSMGIPKSETDKPYFKDVDKDDSDFPYIQAAVEWNIIDEE